MEEFEVRTLSSSPYPHLLLRFVDDTFVINKAEHSQHLLHHINNQDPHIQFTVEDPSQEGTLPFLDTLVAPGPNNTLITIVNRRPTHTDQYLHWDSNHFITAKHNVDNTLAHRAKIVFTNQESLHKELNHISKALQACHFLPWGLKQLQHKFETKNNSNQETRSMDNPPNN